MAEGGECPRWGYAARQEFVAYNTRNGETPMVQQVKRIAQHCKALRKK